MPILPVVTGNESATGCWFMIFAEDSLVDSALSVSTGGAKEISFPVVDVHCIVQLSLYSTTGAVKTVVSDSRNDA